jgi:ATP-binding cassette subfamily B protein RaxB
MNLQQILRRRSQVPFIFQTEAAECALACLAMVMCCHGSSTNLRELRAKHPISLKGVSLLRLLELASENGLNGRAVRADISNLNQLRLPSILHWDFRHFVVLAEVDERRQEAVILDPGKGRSRMSFSEISGYFTGIAVELEPASSFAEKPAAPRVSLRSLIGRVRGLGKAVAQLGALALVLQALMLASPLFLQWVVDRVIVGHDAPLLVALTVGFALLVVIQVALGYMRGWATAHLSVNVMLQWMGSIFSHLLKLPIDYFGKRHLGDVISRIQSTRAIQQTLSVNFVETGIDGLVSILTLSVMLIYSPTLALISLTAVIVYLLLRATTYPLTRDLAEEQMSLAAQQQSHLVESIRGIQSIKIGCKEQQRSVAQMALLGNTANRDFKLARLNLGFASASQLLFGFERIAVISIGAGLVMNASLTVGMLLAYIAYKDQFSARTGSLVDRWMQLRLLRVHTERLADIALTPPEDVDGDPNRRAEQAAVLEVDVSYAYAPSEPFILDGCRLTVMPGESVAITGASGCGKSTLLKVILGLLSPTAGSVRIGGQNIVDFGLRPYRSMVAAVMQDDQLFAGTIEENISFFDLNPDPDQVTNAAKLACMHDDIVQMPMGYRTLVGDMGAALSGGQKQRVILARALYRKPHILFLDEATSHLDLQLEERVNRSLDYLGITRIVIAHRPQTIHAAQQVFRLSGGKLLCVEKTALTSLMAEAAH